MSVHPYTHGEVYAKKNAFAGTYSPAFGHPVMIFIASLLLNTRYILFFSFCINLSNERCSWLDLLPEIYAKQRYFALFLSVGNWWCVSLISFP